MKHIQLGSLYLSLSLSLSRKAIRNRRGGAAIAGDVTLGGSASRRRRSRWWFSSTGSRRLLSSNRKVNSSCVIRFCMCLDYESYCSDRLFCVCYLFVRCIAGDRALSLHGDEAFLLCNRFCVSVATTLSSTATELSSTAT